MHVRFAFVCVLSLAGCAANPTSTSTGGDVRTVTTSARAGRGGVPEARQQAHEAASTTCAAQRARIVTVSEELTYPLSADGTAAAKVNFRCISQ